MAHISKDQTVQYILTMIDDILQASSYIGWLSVTIVSVCEVNRSFNETVHLFVHIFNVLSMFSKNKSAIKSVNVL